jgi:glycosyltransferase involved in cell wall biosynthesis
MTRCVALVSATAGDEVRRAAATGSRPCPDYLRLQERHGVELVDWGSIPRSSGRRSVSQSMRHVRAAMPKISKADVVLSDGEHLGIPLAVAMAALRMNTPHVCIGHHLLTPSKQRVFKALKPQHHINRIVVHSHNQIELLRSSLPGVAPIVCTVPYAVDVDFWSPRGGRPSPNLVASAGKEHRDYATLVAALPDDADLFVAEDSPFSPAARGQAPEAWPARVGRGSLDPRGLRDLYERAAVVVVPVLDTNFPAGITTLLEAMAMAKAVIVSGTDALVEVVDDGRSGVVVPPGDVGRMAAAIEVLLADAERRRALGAEARKTVMERFGLDDYVDALADLLREVSGCPSDTSTRRWDKK